MTDNAQEQESTDWYDLAMVLKTMHSLLDMKSNRPEFGALKLELSNLGIAAFELSKNALRRSRALAV